MAISELELESTEFACVPFRSGVSDSYSSPDISLIGFQSQMLWGLIFLVQVSWAGDRSAQTPCSSVRDLCGYGIAFILGHWPRGVGLTRLHFCSWSPSMSPFLYILSCRKSVLLIFRLFLEIVVVLYEVVLIVFVYPWEEVSSESSRSAILIPGGFFFFFAETDKLFLKCTGKHKGPRTKDCKSNFKKMNEAGRLTLPHFKTFYKAYSNQVCIILA